jgi:hypothetical protein
MCCFSGEVEYVGNTKIFARSTRHGRQTVVYTMSYSADKELAMILPIPVPKDSPEDSVIFVNMEDYKEFFNDLNEGFPVPKSWGLMGSADEATEESAEEAPLEVHQVGSYVASFVPTVNDFDRLDEQFRLDNSVWENLPQYADYGFAVFQLKKGAFEMHPMAFEFPISLRRPLFFPAVHIHDGKVHDTAYYDHVLYFQLNPYEYPVRAKAWRRIPGDRPEVAQSDESAYLAKQFMNRKTLDEIQKTDGVQLIDGKEHCYRQRIRGDYNNRDIWV